MITLLTGANSYEAEQWLSQIVAGFDGMPEKLDGTELELKQLPDLLMGLSLFAEKRLVIIRGIAENKSVWEALPELLARMSDDIHVVFVEPTVDKRTKTYKALQKLAEVKDFPLLTERDSVKAEQWLVAEAKRRGLTLDKAAARLLVQRSLLPADRGQPVIDQWQLAHAIDKLSVFGDITAEMVEKYIDNQPVDSVFGVFETALRGDREVLHQLLADLEPYEDPYKVFGLLASQVFQLAALHASDESPSDTAKAIGVHPFAMSKLAPLARKLSSSQVRQVVLAMSVADEAMKTSKGAPWTLIEQALMKITVVSRSD